MGDLILVGQKEKTFGDPPNSLPIFPSNQTTQKLIFPSPLQNHSNQIDTKCSITNGSGKFISHKPWSIGRLVWNFNMHASFNLGLRVGGLMSLTNWVWGTLKSIFCGGRYWESEREREDHQKMNNKRTVGMDLRVDKDCSMIVYWEDNERWGLLLLTNPTHLIGPQ